MTFPRRVSTLLIVFVLSMPPLVAENSAAVVSGGYVRQTPVNVAPGQIITFFVHGIGSDLKKAVRASTVPLPTTLAGISAMFIQSNPPIEIPIVAVEPIGPCANSSQPGCATSYTGVTLQIPFNISATDPQARVGAIPAGGQIRFSENGSIIATVDVLPFVDQVHIVRSCDEMMSTRDPSCAPIVTHPNGSLVNDENPAKAGETLVMYAVGLGYTTNPVPNGRAPDAPARTSIKYGLDFDVRPNAGASRPPANTGTTHSPIFTGLIPGFVGVYQINISLPAFPDGILSCDPSPLGRYIVSNLTVNIFGPASVDGVGICVKP